MSKQKYPQTATVTTAGGVTVRKGREHYSHAKSDAKKKRRQQEADDRQFKYDGLTTAQKLKGLGPTGSNRQRKRLEALLALEKAPAVKQAPLTDEQKSAKAVKRAKDAVAA
jgi:hypothetical protein